MAAEVRVMAMGRRRAGQGELFTATADLARSSGHPFYRRLNQLLGEAGFARASRHGPWLLFGRRPRPARCRRYRPNARVTRRGRDDLSTAPSFSSSALTRNGGSFGLPRSFVMNAMERFVPASLRSATSTASLRNLSDSSHLRHTATLSTPKLPDGSTTSENDNPPFSASSFSTAYSRSLSMSKSSRLPRSSTAMRDCRPT